MKTHHRCTDKCQFFHWMIHGWCITHLTEIIEAEPDLAVRHDAVDISAYRPHLPIDERPEGTVSLFGYTGLDREHARTVDLTRPILVGAVYDKTGAEVSKLVIDGWHRMYRALTEGITTLPALVVAKEANLAARIEVFIR